MKTIGGLHAQMTHHANLVRAVARASRGRRGQPAVRAFGEHWEREMDRLREQLATGELQCGACSRFWIRDPKRRLITAPVFRERVLHHAVINVCGPVLDARLCPHTYACRPGKGALAALHTAKNRAAAAPFFLKLDVRKYFDSIPHERLFAALGRVFRERAVLRVFAQLVEAYRPGEAQGLAIGSLISQHLANYYLAPMDNLILQELRPAGYARYMDDLALWFPSLPAARAARDGLAEFARDQLELDFKTAFINRSVLGMDFLGYRVFPGRMALNRRSRQRYRDAIRRVHRRWAAGELDEATAQSWATALTAFTSHANCRNWRRGVLKDLGEEPWTGTAPCAAATGTTTGRTPAPRTATPTGPTTRTTTSGSVPVPAPAAGRSALMEQVSPPVPGPPAMDKMRTNPPPAGNLEASVDAGTTRAAALSPPSE